MPKFQKRHYTAIADLLSRAESDPAMQAALFTSADISKMVRLCVEMFGRDNPRFDATRFVTACHAGRTDG